MTAGIKRSGKEGFSLLEVLISLAILAVGLLGLAMFQVTAIKGNAVASRWTVATQLTQDRLENFRHLPWDNIVSSAGGFNPATMQPVYSSVPGAASADDIYVDNVSTVTYYTVSYVNNNSATFKTITVWTCWQDDRAAWHNVMLTTQRARMGGV